MRWYWIDRFTEFVSGHFAVAVKNVSLGEEQLHDYFPGHPLMPNALVVEGMAQTGGTLLGEATAYRERLVLAKIAQARFYFPARPGDTLIYKVTLESRSREGALLSATSHVGDRLQAEAEFYLAVLGDKHGRHVLFEPADFGRLLRVLGVYDVGRSADGQKLEMPEHIRQLEQQDAALRAPG